MPTIIRTLKPLETILLENPGYYFDYKLQLIIMPDKSTMHYSFFKYLGKDITLLKQEPANRAYPYIYSCFGSFFVNESWIIEPEHPVLGDVTYPSGL